MGEAKRRRAAGKAGSFGDYLMVPDFMMPSFRGLFEELVRESMELQPSRPGEFSRHAAAIHEASHCVVAAREGLALTAARIFPGPLGNWLGDFHLDRKHGGLSADAPEFLGELRIMLAGRRGELLCFGERFCLRAGLDELTWALMMVMIPLAVQAGDDQERSNKLYGPTWDTTLAETDETLLTHRSIVDAIAARLMQEGSVERAELAQMVAPIPARSEQPPIRDVPRIAFDPLAHPPDDPRRELWKSETMSASRRLPLLTAP